MIKLNSIIIASFLSATSVGTCSADAVQDKQLAGKRNILPGNIQEKYGIE